MPARSGVLVSSLTLGFLVAACGGGGGRGGGGGGGGPIVTAVSPSTAPGNGGTPVTITGNGFVPGATIVLFGGVNTGVVSATSTELAVHAPPGSGPVTVSVVVNGVTSSLPNGFTYGPRLVVNSVSPATGPLVGFTPITISGTGFLPSSPAIVTFGLNSQATNVVVANDTTIQALTPPQVLPGQLDVSVTQAGVTSRLTSGFNYARAPLVQSVFPLASPVNQTQNVTISGTFTQGATATVTFGTTLATNVVVVNGTTITATAPAATQAGSVNVSVTQNGLTGSQQNGYRYF